MSRPRCVNSVIGISKHLVTSSYLSKQRELFTGRKLRLRELLSLQTWVAIKKTLSLSCVCKFIVFALAAVKLKTVAWPESLVPLDHLGKICAFMWEKPQKCWETLGRGTKTLTFPEIKEIFCLYYHSQIVITEALSGFLALYVSSFISAFSVKASSHSVTVDLDTRKYFLSGARAMEELYRCVNLVCFNGSQCCDMIHTQSTTIYSVHFIIYVICWLCKVWVCQEEKTHGRDRETENMIQILVFKLDSITFHCLFKC